MTIESESIPDSDLLWRWVPRNKINSKARPTPAAFKEHGTGMSTDWNKYSTAEESRRRSPRPSDFGIARFCVANIRALTLTVAHSPRDWDQAHSDVTGIGDEEIRMKLRDLAIMELLPI